MARGSACPALLTTPGVLAFPALLPWHGCLAALLPCSVPCAGAGEVLSSEDCGMSPCTDSRHPGMRRCCARCAGTGEVLATMDADTAHFFEDLTPAQLNSTLVVMLADHGESFFFSFWTCPEIHQPACERHAVQQDTPRSGHSPCGARPPGRPAGGAAAWPLGALPPQAAHAAPCAAAGPGCLPRGPRMCAPLAGRLIPAVGFHCAGKQGWRWVSMSTLTAAANNFPRACVQG